MINKYKHIIGFFLLSTILVIPYMIKLIVRLEPYPAIILPSGAGKVERKDDSFQFTRTNIYGLGLVSGEWERRDPKSFLNPIHVHFLSAIIKNDFGLNPDLEYTVSSRGNLIPSFTYNNRDCLTEKNISYTKSWLRTRLSNHGCKNEMIIVRQVLLSADLKTREITEIGITNEKTYHLF